MINPVFLKTFFSISKTGSFTQTAKDLAMTQPGVSQHIKKIEEELGVEMILRDKKPIELTPAGEKLLTYVEHSFKRYEKLKSNLDLDLPYTGPCKISSPGSFGINFYSFILKQQKKHKDLNIFFNYAPDYLIEENLLSNAINLGIMSRRPNSSELVYKKIAEEKLMLVIPSKFKNSSIKEILDLGFIDHPDGKRRIMEILSLNFPELNLNFEDLNIRGEHNQIHRLLEPVSLGIGYTVLPEFACLEFKDKKKIHFYNLSKVIKNSIYIVQKRNKKLPRRYEQLIQDYLNQ